MTGLRVNEATALRRKEEINLEKGTLTVNHSLRLKNKADWSLGTPKTKVALRKIAIDTDTIFILKNWKKRQEEFSDIKLVLFYNGSPTWKSTVARIISRHAKLAGVKTIQAKGLRHSHASFLINEYNATPLVIKDRLGHEDIKTTLSTYSHLYPNVNFEIANSISGTIKFNPSATNKKHITGTNTTKKSKKAKINLAFFFTLIPAQRLRPL